MESSTNSLPPYHEVSVVLAVYNGEKYLHKQLSSILAQKFVTIKELIIVDDQSTDQSAEIIRQFQQKHLFIQFLKNPVNVGPIGSFITGAKLSTSTYTAFADQDDIWLDDKLYLSLNQIKKIDDSEKPAVVFSDLEMIDENDTTIYPSFWNLYDINPAKNNFFTIAFGNIATGCTMLVNRQMLDEFIDMPTNAQMHDHWIMLIASSFGNWSYLNKQTVLYRVHHRSVTDKSKITLRKKASNFLKASFNKNADFLMPAIDQAILFKEKYGGVLNENIKKQLVFFIKLENTSGFNRKILSKFRFWIVKWI